MVKFDCAGFLMSRHRGLQPSQSRPVSVNVFCLGIVTSQNINFRDSLPPTDCVSLYKTYIGCILHILVYIDAKFYGLYSLFMGRCNDSTMPKRANDGVSLYTRNRAPEWRWVSPTEIDLSSY